MISSLISCVILVRISQKQAWWPLSYFRKLKSRYFRDYFCSFSSKSHYFYILGVSHLNFTMKHIPHNLRMVAVSGFVVVCCGYIIICIWYNGSVYPFSLWLLHWRRGNAMICMGAANERRRYNVTSSPIGWAHTPNCHCIHRTYSMKWSWRAWLSVAVIKWQQHTIKHNS